MFKITEKCSEQQKKIVSQTTSKSEEIKPCVVFVSAASERNITCRFLDERRYMIWCLICVTGSLRFFFFVSLKKKLHWTSIIQDIHVHM